MRLPDDHWEVRLRGSARCFFEMGLKIEMIFHTFGKSFAQLPQSQFHSPCSLDSG